MLNIELQPAYLLHSRNYRDSSIIADIWTPEYGRISVLVKGARRRKGGSKHLLIPFAPLLISCKGRGELKTLTHIEFAAPAYTLHQAALFSGFYINELLLRLLPVADACPALFSRYSEAVEQLNSNTDIEITLRLFEWYLLSQLGYALNFSDDIFSQPIAANNQYSLDSHKGFFFDVRGVYSGEALQAIAGGDYSHIDTRRAAKSIARAVFQSLLGSKPLNSRDMYRQMIS